MSMFTLLVIICVGLSSAKKIKEATVENCEGKYIILLLLNGETRSRVINPCVKKKITVRYGFGVDS